MISGSITAVKQPNEADSGTVTDIGAAAIRMKQYDPVYLILIAAALAACFSFQASRIFLSSSIKVPTSLNSR